MSAWLSALPWWLVAGLALGVAFTLVAAGLFYAGTRLFPDPDHGDDERTSGDERRRAEIRAYLDALGEQYAENHLVAGQRVAFYLPAREVAITFDPQAHFGLDGADAESVLVEHELPGAALGQRLPFDTPDPTPDDDRDRRTGSRWGRVPDDGDPAADALAELGLPADATLPEVESAYREQVKHVHPDQGGDPEEFRRVQEAYAAAKEALAETDTTTSAG